MPSPYTVTEVAEVYDWDGTPYNKAVLNHLCVGCIVRVIVNNSQGGWEKIYADITKIKDGTVWGTVCDTYRMEDNEPKNGSTISFRLKCVMEIPLTWQPKPIQKQFTNYLKE